MKVVILAGGKGTRLRPFTVSLPKPLMPVGDYPIVEILLRQLKRAGLTDVIISVGHLESLIRAYLGGGERLGVNIEYVSEGRPMGTAGPLSLMRDRLTETFMLINGDVLTDLDIPALIRYHKGQGAVATVGMVKRTVHIDFGVVELDEGGRFSRWSEKPVIEYLVSTGINVLEPGALELVPEGFFNVPDLIVALHGAGCKVMGYRHEGFWLDIGRVQDYQEACQLMERGELDIV